MCVDICQSRINSKPACCNTNTRPSFSNTRPSLSNTRSNFSFFLKQGDQYFLEHKFQVFPGIFQVLFLFFQASLFSSKQDQTDVHVSEEKIFSYQQPLLKLISLHPALKVTFKDQIPQTAFSKRSNKVTGMLCSTCLL